MDRTDIIYNLARILNCEARKNEPLSRHTTFKIGGCADTYVKVTSVSKLSAILKECEESDVDYMIIGNGSNIGGTCLHRISDESRRVIDAADIIISKGQANFETLYECGKNIYYIFMCKCALFKERFNVPMFTGMLINDKDL